MKTSNGTLTVIITYFDGQKERSNLAVIREMFKDETNEWQKKFYSQLNNGIVKTSYAEYRLIR